LELDSKEVQRERSKMREKINEWEE